MKRLTLLCIALLSLTMLRANVISGTCGDNLTWQYDTKDHSLVISGSGEMWDFDYEGSPCPWQTVSGSITSISLPAGLTRIGSKAFNGCSNLTTIDLPSSLTSIGSHAFYSARLKSLVFPNSVTEIEYEAFGNNSELQSVTLPNNLQTLSSYVFYACYELRSIAIPASITTIGECALNDCYEVYLESSTPATITNSTFRSNVVLHVPCNSVNAYQNAPIWQFLTIMGNMDYEFILSADEGGTARIAKSVCEANTLVIEATADAGYRFTGWSDGNTDNPRAIVLTSDKSVTAQFEQSTTYFHVSLSGISYMEYNNGSSNGPNWSGEVLEGSYIRFEAITNCGTFTGWSDGSEYTYRNIQITSDTTITASYTGIETYQVSISAGEHGHLSNEIVGEVSSCANSFEVRAIPDEGYHFVEWSDGYESSYRWFNINSDITVYAIFAKGEYGGKLGETLYWSFETDKSQITVTGSGEMTEHGYGYIGYFEETEDNMDGTIEKLLIEDGATNISKSIFKSLRRLQSAELAGSIERIEESAFEDCRSLVSVTFVTPSALDYIGDWAFYNCHELQSLAIPEGVTEIGKAAFFGCTYLKDVTLPASIRAIGDNAFALCSKMEKLQVNAVVPPIIAAKTFEDVSREMPVYVPETSFEAYIADPYWGELNIVGAITAIETVESTSATASQVLRDGQIFILRDGKTYSVQGLEVR